MRHNLLLLYAVHLNYSITTAAVEAADKNQYLYVPRGQERLSPLKKSSSSNETEALPKRAYLLYYLTTLD